MFKKLMTTFVCLVVSVFCIFATGCSSSGESNHYYSLTISARNYSRDGSAAIPFGGVSQESIRNALRSSSKINDVVIAIYDGITNNQICDETTVIENMIISDGSIIHTLNLSSENIWGKDIRVEIRKGNGTIIKAYKTAVAGNDTIAVNCDTSAYALLFEELKLQYGASFNYSIFEKALQIAQSTEMTNAVTTLSGEIRLNISSFSDGNINVREIYNKSNVVNVMELAEGTATCLTETIQNLLDGVNPTSNEKIDESLLPSELRGLNWQKVTSQNINQIKGNTQDGKNYLIQSHIYYNNSWYKWILNYPYNNIDTKYDVEYIPYLYFESDFEVECKQYKSEVLANNLYITFNSDGSGNNIAPNASINASEMIEEGGNFFDVAVNGYSIDTGNSTVQMNGKTKYIRIATSSSDFNTYVVLYDNTKANSTEIYRLLTIY